MTKWWDTDLAASAQALNSDPATALQAATLPATLLKNQKAYEEQQKAYLKSKERQDTEEDRLGWIKDLSNGISGAFGKADNVLSEVPGWGVTKQVVGYPIDKVASGMHWAYSEVLSQPLSTALLATGQADLSGDFWSTIVKGSTWSKSYNKAEHISPGQAFMNFENTAEAAGQGDFLTGLIGGGADNLTSEQRDAIKRNSTRYLYDTDYWHEKQGWTYTLGSGGIDFFLVMAADPTYLAAKSAAPLIKGARNLTTTQAARANAARGIVEGQTVTTVGQHSLSEVVDSKKMQGFADWIPGKLPEQIEKHPIWGVGRRKNPHAGQYSQLLAGERPESVGLIARFAGGDDAAMREMATNSQNLTMKIGRLEDNRSLVDSAKFDPEILAHYAEGERVYPKAAPEFYDPGKLVEPPYPRPTTPGPAQSGWDKTYGRLALHKEAAEAISGGLTSAMPKGAAADSALAFAAKADEWKAAQIKLMDQELEGLKAQEGFYQTVLGENFGLRPEEMTAAGSNLFGTLDSFHRMGPLALKNTEKLADKRWAKATGERTLLASRKAPGAKALASRVIRTGMYSTPVRVFQAFGDRVPERFIDHSAPDATERVIGQLRNVKGLDNDVRQAMIASYSNAGDKIARSQELEKINLAVVEHMGQQRGIDGSMSRAIADQMHIKMASEHSKITGIRNPSERFGTLTQTDEAGNVDKLTDPVTGHRIDAAVDGEAWIIAPFAKTQLQRAEPLLDVNELGRALDKSAGLIKSARASGSDAMDVLTTLADHFQSVWKLAALMRPGYVIRNVTEANAAAAAKFGALSVAANLGKGTGDWFANRGFQIASYAGLASYTPTTGAGIMSKLGRVRLGTPEEVARFGNLDKNIKVSRINVPSSVHYAEGVIKHERELHAASKAAAEQSQKDFDAWAGTHRQAYANQVGLDSAASDLSDVYARTSLLREEVAKARTSIVGKRYQRVQEERPTVGAEAEAQAASATKDSDELLNLHNEARNFLKEAERGASDAKTQWGDSSWKYGAQQLDELRAWEAKVAKEQQKASIRTGVSESAVANAEKVAKERIAEFNKVMTSLVGNRDWWQSALTVAERNELEARKILGEKAYKANYIGKPTMDEGKRLLENLNRHRANMDDHASVIKEYSDYAGAVIRAAEKSQGARLGHGEYEYRGIKIPEAFSDKWDNPIVPDEVTSKYGNQVMFSRYEAIGKERLAKTGSWVDILPGTDTHMDEWLRAINLQFGQDDLFRLVAKDPREALAWTKTGMGKNHLRLLGPHGREPEDLIRKIDMLLDHYVPAEGGIRDKFINGEQVYAKDLHAAVPKNAFPVVHGEEVRALVGKERHLTASAMVDDMISKSFNRLATIPTDILANHPIYLMAQRARMKQGIDKELAFRRASGKSEVIDGKTMNQLLAKTDQLARKDITQVVYDPTRTSATEGLRFVAPFMAAQVDGLQRWSGLMAERPELISRASQIYGAPVAANLITDKNGNHVGQDGYAVIKDADGKVVRRDFVPLPDRVFHLRWPGQNPDKQSKGDLPISLNALNVIMPGDPWFNPGSGPLVQVGGNVLAKEVPATGDFLQWAKVLPFGPTSTTEALTPKWMRSAYDAWTAGDAGNEKYQKALMATYNKNLADWKLGGSKGQKPSWDKAAKEAKHFMFLQALTAFSTPAQTMETPLSGTPYQFYVDQYKQLQDTNPQDADDIFWKRYGEDYYQFTTSMSKSIGIAPTMEAVYTSKEYEDMLAAQPELAGFIMNKRDRGQFSSTAYAVQQDQLIGGEQVRGKLTAEQAAKANEAQAGWKAYSDQMNQLDAMLLKVGFKSYDQKGAEKFALIKKAVQSSTAEQYPAWDEDFNQTDAGKVDRRIEGLSRLVMDPRLANDPIRTDVAVMRDYLAMRAQFKQALTNMGLQSLSFGAGAGPTQQGVQAQPTGTPQAQMLASQWRMVQMSFIQRDTDFGDMFHRYLSNDNLQ